MLNSLTTFGLRQLKITSQTGDVTAYLPAAQTLILGVGILSVVGFAA